MRIILIRHGESQANVDKNLHRILPDHEIALSSLGKEQAIEAGKRLQQFYSDRYQTHWAKEGKWNPHIAVWNSPYRRTRETAALICEQLQMKRLTQLENVLLCEQQFGMFDGLEDKEIEQKFPEEFKSWQNNMKFKGKFWARYPMGESPFDVAVRIKQSFSMLNETIDNIVVCHGTVAKLFPMMWFNHTPEWYADAKTIGNCGFYLIEDRKDVGWHFPGYKKGKLVQEHAE